MSARTSAQRRFHTKIYLRITYHARGFNDGCALAGRHGRAHRRRPYPSPSCLSVQSTHNQQPLQPRSCNTIHHLNGRGGACVPARTSAQRRFHTKIYLRIMHEDLTMDAPSQGDTGGHTGTAPTHLHLHHAFPSNSPITNGHFGHVPAKPFFI